MIAQLRNTGTLSSTPRPATTLVKAAANKPAAQQVARVIAAARRHSDTRWLAPAADQVVLP
jgi:hypothetical protein